jgi:hypothetical protein
MMKNILIVLLASVFTISFGQNWNYKSGVNAFDGKYKTASTVGKGGKFPYNDPIFVVNLFDNNNLNVYISNTCYAGCDDKKAYIKFDGDVQMYTYSISTNSENNSWFIDYQRYSSDYDSVSMIKLLDKIKLHSKMFIRLSSSCGQYDYEFSLKGSTAAINFVAGNYIAKIKQNDFAQKKEEKDREILFKKINSGVHFKAKASHYCKSIYYGNSYTLYDKTLVPGEEIIFSNNPKQKYWILHNATTIKLSPDTSFYIEKFCLDVDSITEIKND